MLPINVAIFSQMQKFLQDAPGQIDRFRTVETAFTRSRQLTFTRLVLLILGQLRKSLSIELFIFFRSLGDLAAICSKSAFSQARQKLDAQFFVAWNDHLTKVFYQSDAVRRWKGKRLIAVDGTMVRLPNQPELREHFGDFSASNGSVPLAQGLCCYDLLNELSLDAQLAPCRKTENELLRPYFDQLSPDMLLIGDRHFGIILNIYLMLEKGKDFLFRLTAQSNMVKAFLSTGKADLVQSVPLTKDGRSRLKAAGIPRPSKEFRLQLRFIRIELPSGETEILVTSLLDQQQYHWEDFNQLYQLRWGIETFFDRIKNQFYLQIFSGYSIEAVRQDFFAAILLHNLQSIAIKPAQEAIEQENRQPKLHKDRKYLQQINRNTTLGIFKIFLLELLTYPPEETKALFEMLNIHFRKQKQPIRKGRQFPRKKQMKKRKNTPGTAIHQKRAF